MDLEMQQRIIRQLAESENGGVITDYLKLAITDNKTYLALTPTTAQNTAQLKAVTKQMNKVLRLILNQLEDTE
jgi:hypothetical protein